MVENPPQGPTVDHDHSGPGEGGDTLNVDDVNLDDLESFDFGDAGDISLEFDPNVGGNGALIATDEINNATLFEWRIGGTLTLPQDDTQLQFGAGQDVGVEFDDGNDDLRWVDVTNTADRMALDRTTGNLNIDGSLTEGASL